MQLLVALKLPSPLVQALCWTLVHSLWQGLLLAMAAGLVVQLTRKASPALRYNLLASLLGVFLVSSGLTFWLALGTSSATTPAITGSSEIVRVPTWTDIPPVLLSSGSSLSWPAAFAQFCTTHASGIVLVWFLVFAYKSLRLAGGMHYVNRLRKEQVSPVPSFWLTRLAELCERLQVRVPVSLLESGLVNVPVAIGFLKPLVLVPTGMLAQLPPDQIEAILLHELAHIRRRDYLVNLLQTVAEVLYFFNPGVLWLSGYLRQEREHCCDDMAIQALQSKTNFLQALVTFEEFNLRHVRLVTGFADKRTSLTDRVNRIISQDNVPLQRTEKLFTGICLLLVSVLFLELGPQNTPALSAELPAQALEVPRPGKSPLHSSTPGLPAQTSAPRNQKVLTRRAPQKAHSKQTTPQEFSTVGIANKSYDGILQRYSFERNGILYEIEKDSLDVLTLTIDGEQASQAQVQQYKNSMKSLMQQYQQGAFRIVVNGEVPDVETEPANPIMVGFIRNGTIITTHDSSEYVVKVKNHKTVQFKINEEVIAEDKLQNYLALIQDLIQEAEADRVYAELSAKAVEQLARAPERPATGLVPFSTSDFQDHQYTYLPRSKTYRNKESLQPKPDSHYLLPAI
ncbi:M56 family metallopeptidase [Rufibacter sediminis]|uniref:M48 family metalloprotease n=1 Tax=Rufibacter sediminis TaxID=2762756 RepID=A0ABR6VW41_9BACT|nr:M56 family metallopeptidase [Rufibacter sediminis]MBC3541428.1 M48 family metalloprotease [Rufibacter sediminis]